MSADLSPYTITVLALETVRGMSWYWLPQTITAIVSIAIAVRALQVSNREARKTQKHNLRESRRMRKHNEISVMPLLNIGEKHNFGKGNSDMRFMLENVGVGPAIVTHFAMFFDDKEFIFPKEKDEIKNQIQHAISFPHILGSGYAFRLAAGARHDLLTVEIEQSETEARVLAKRIGFKIEYQSIYQNEKFICEVCNSSGYPKDQNPTSEKQKG